MRVNLNDLPEKYRKQALRQIASAGQSKMTESKIFLHGQADKFLLTIQEKLEKEYLECKNIKMVAEKFGIVHDTLWKFFKKHGIIIHHRRWAKEEDEIIRMAYGETPNMYVDLDAMADKLSRSHLAVVLRAERMGLKVQGRQFTQEMRDKCSCVQKKRAIEHPEDSLQKSKYVKEWLKNNPHPRGMLGNHHSEAMKKNHSGRIKDLWKDPSSCFNSKKYRQSISDRVSAEASTRKVQNIYSRCKRGFRKDIGIFVRSSWEANYARYLNFLIFHSKIKGWRYEPQTFWFEKIKRGVRSFLPDFEVINMDDSIEYHEVKGWMDARSKTKLKRMAKYYPKERVILIDQARYKEIKKTVSNIIPNWE